MNTLNKFFLPVAGMVSMAGFASAEYAWDVLRPLSDVAISIDFLTRLIVLALSLAIFLVSYKAYKRVQDRKFLFITIAFGLFTLKWLLKALDLFISPGIFFNDSSENVFELLILASLFYALFKKH